MYSSLPLRPWLMRSCHQPEPFVGCFLMDIDQLAGYCTKSTRLLHSLTGSWKIDLFQPVCCRYGADRITQTFSVLESENMSYRIQNIKKVDYVTVRASSFVQYCQISKYRFSMQKCSSKFGYWLLSFLTPVMKEQMKKCHLL